MFNPDKDKEESELEEGEISEEPMRLSHDEHDQDRDHVSNNNNQSSSSSQLAIDINPVFMSQPESIKLFGKRDVDLRNIYHDCDLRKNVNKQSQLTSSTVSPSNYTPLPSLASSTVTNQSVQHHWQYQRQLPNQNLLYSNVNRTPLLPTQQMPISTFPQFNLLNTPFVNPNQLNPKPRPFPNEAMFQPRPSFNTNVHFNQNYINRLMSPFLGQINSQNQSYLQPNIASVKNTMIMPQSENINLPQETINRPPSRSESPYDPGQDIVDNNDSQIINDDNQCQIDDEINKSVTINQPMNTRDIYNFSDFLQSNAIRAPIIEHDQHYEEELNSFLKKLNDNEDKSKIVDSLFKKDEKEERFKRLLCIEKTENRKTPGSRKMLTPKKFSQRSPISSNDSPQSTKRHKPDNILQKSPLCPNIPVQHKNKKKKKKQISKKGSTKQPQVAEQQQKKNFENASYDDLLEEYRKIMDQLHQLDAVSEENDNENSANQDSKNEIVENRGKRKRRRRRRRHKGPKLKEQNDDYDDDLMPRHDNLLEMIIETKNQYDDEDLLELRRIALESKKNKVQINIETDNNQEAPDNRDDNDEEVDENFLREQLLNMMQKKEQNEVQSKESKEITEQLVKEQQDLEKTVFKNDYPQFLESNTSRGLMRKINYQEIKANEIKLLRNDDSNKFIINFGDDSSSDEDQEEEDNEQSNTTANSMPIDIDSFIKQVRTNASNEQQFSNNLSINKSKSALNKLSLAQQLEYQRLKELIERKEQNFANKKLLVKKEVEWKEAKARLHEKFAKMKMLKAKVLAKRNEFRKAQQNARKMYDAYLNATKLVKSNAFELNTLNSQLKTLEESTSDEQQLTNKLQNACINIGTRVQGKNYKLPSETKSRTESESRKEELDDEKKRLQLRAMALSERLEYLKNTKASTNTTTNQLNNKVQEDAKKFIDKFTKNISNTTLFFASTSLDSFVNSLFLDKYIKRFKFKCQVDSNDKNHDYPTVTIINKDQQQNDYKSFCDNNGTSVLSHLHSYRLIEYQKENICSLHWTNNVNPHQYLCLYDLVGTCNDEKCYWQHLKSCVLGSVDKVVDLLLYDPEVADCHVNESKYDVESFKQKLRAFALKFINNNADCSIEVICQKIAKLIREKKQEDICTLTRCLSKTFNQLTSDNNYVPLDDLKYKFSFKDRSLVLNHAKIRQLRLTSDPEIYITKRFYAPEGVPLSAELETSLASDSSNIQLWIKLAYHHIAKDYKKKHESIDKALNVLSRALEFNKTNPELYEHFLFIYSNRKINNSEKENSKYSLMSIGQKIVSHCSHYRVWKRFLSLCLNFEDKEKVSLDLLKYLLNKNLSEDEHYEEYSHQILEVFLYRVRLYLQVNDLTKAKKIFQETLYDRYADGRKLTYKLIQPDLIFAWLLYLHLMFFNSLPSHCFEPFHQSFSGIIDKNWFLFPWLQLDNSVEKNYILDLFNDAFNACKECHVLPLLANLIKYEISRNLKSSDLTLKTFETVSQQSKNDLLYWKFIAQLKYLESGSNEVIQSLKTSHYYWSNEIEIVYLLTFHYYELNDFDNARSLLLRIAQKFFNCDLNNDNLKIAYKSLLLEDYQCIDNNLVESRISKQYRSVRLWLCYILLLYIDDSTKEDVESAFQSALAACCDDQISKSDLQLLWWQYIKFLVETLEYQWQFDNLTSLIRHCCLTIKDTLFQYQLVHFYCKLLTDTNEKLKSLIQFAKLLPENNYVLLAALSLSLKVKCKELGWELINYIVFEKKLKPLEENFWKICIAMSLEKYDYLSIHKLFQLSLSNMPYNNSLWELFFNYEASINHTEHIKQGKTICDKNLKIKINILDK